MRLDPRRLLRARTFLLLLGLGLLLDAMIRFPGWAPWWFMPPYLPPYLPVLLQKYMGAALVALWWWLRRRERISSSDGKHRN